MFNFKKKAACRVQTMQDDVWTTGGSDVALRLFLQSELLAHDFEH